MQAFTQQRVHAPSSIRFHVSPMAGFLALVALAAAGGVYTSRVETGTDPCEAATSCVQCLLINEYKGYLKEMQYRVGGHFPEELPKEADYTKPFDCYWEPTGLLSTGALDGHCINKAAETQSWTFMSSFTTSRSREPAQSKGPANKYQEAAKLGEVLDNEFLQVDEGETVPDLGPLLRRRCALAEQIFRDDMPPEPCEAATSCHQCNEFGAAHAAFAREMTERNETLLAHGDPAGQRSPAISCVWNDAPPEGQTHCQSATSEHHTNECK